MQEAGIDISENTSNHVDEYAKNILWSYHNCLWSCAGKTGPVYPKWKKHSAGIIIFTDPSKLVSEKRRWNTRGFLLQTRDENKGVFAKNFRRVLFVVVIFFAPVKPENSSKTGLTVLDGMSFDFDVHQSVYSIVKKGGSTLKEATRAFLFDILFDKYWQPQGTRFQPHQLICQTCLNQLKSHQIQNSFIGIVQALL